MERILENNLLLEVSNLPEHVGSITTTKYSNILMLMKDTGSKSKKFYVDLNFLWKHFSIKKVILTEQLHTNNIRLVEEKMPSEYYGCDGLVTSKSYTAIGIITADCFVVQLYGRNLIANLHCGWRGIYAGIIEKACIYFSEVGEEICGAIVGPGICEKCYVVSYDFVEKFDKKYGSHNFYNIIDKKYHFSLRSIIEYILKKSGIYNISHLDCCSSCSNLLYSYRRDNKTDKRMLSLIWKK